MNRKFFALTAFMLFFVLALSACGVLAPRPTVVEPAQNIAATNDSILQAAQATATQMALLNQIAQLQTQIAIATEDAQATRNAPQQAATATPQQQDPVVVQPTATSVPPTATPVPPTATPVPPTATPVPPTPTAIPCNAAQFVADVSIPDGTTLAPGANFTKTWRLKNVGACTWTTSYDLVFHNGDSLSTTTVVDFPGSVAPGQVIDLSVNMVAPSKEGRYRSNWKLRDGGGVLFGLGQTSASFYADIKVVGVVSKYPLDFVASMCLAEWHSAAGRLACPGTDKDSRGFVLRADKPTLESGYVDDESALVTHPQMINDGVIRGFYPVYKVQPGDHFKAIIGCARGAKNCDVNFQLEYQIGDGAIQTFKTWREVYDEQQYSVDIDLSSLEGKEVKFILTVFANGSSTDDRAQWLAPRIVR